MVVFKVVGKRTRWGSNITIYRNSYPLNKRLIEARRLCIKYPNYFPKYSKGATVTGVADTPGIMCFEERKYAEDFLRTYLLHDTAKIIRVRGIGRPKYSFKIFFSCGDTPEYLWTLDESSKLGEAIPGTIAFESVKILD